MKRKALLLLLFLLLLGLLTGCFRDVLSWSPDGRYLSYIEPKEERLFIWDSKTDQSKIALQTTRTATAIFLPKRWFAGQEMLVAKSPGRGGDICDLSIFHIGSGRTDLITTHAVLGNYDIGTRGWIYYIIEQGNEKPGQKHYALWGYNIRRNSPHLIYQSDTEMSFPNSDGSGHLLASRGDDKKYDIMEIDGDRGTTHSIATFTGTGAWYPMWGDKGKKNVFYLETKDGRDSATLCRINLETKTTESLITDVTPMCRTQISKDGKWAAATVIKTVAAGKESAVVRVNLQGRPVVEYLTPKDGVALYGTLSPDGNRLAYCVGDADNYEKVVVKDLKSGAEKVVWQGKKE